MDLKRRNETDFVYWWYNCLYGNSQRLTKQISECHSSLLKLINSSSMALGCKVSM